MCLSEGSGHVIRGLAAGVQVKRLKTKEKKGGAG